MVSSPKHLHFNFLNFCLILYLFSFSFLLLFFCNRISLCNRPGCFGTHFGDQESLELTEILCLCLPSARNKGIHQPCLASLFFESIFSFSQEVFPNYPMPCSLFHPHVLLLLLWCWLKLGFLPWTSLISIYLYSCFTQWFSPSLLICLLGNLNFLGFFLEYFCSTWPRVYEDVYMSKGKASADLEVFSHINNKLLKELTFYFSCHLFHFGIFVHIHHCILLKFTTSRGPSMSSLFSPVVLFYLVLPSTYERWL